MKLRDREFFSTSLAGGRRREYLHKLFGNSPVHRPNIFPSVSHLILIIAASYPFNIGENIAARGPHLHSQIK